MMDKYGTHRKKQPTNHDVEKKLNKPLAIVPTISQHSRASHYGEIQWNWIYLLTGIFSAIFLGPSE